ncbi:hypothetical protein RO3G_02551 [Rhizopus delemar RA 99-880]|uniref:Uncharacterized protein n=1 Tax=Rhizopus delemar (strain RA 99-880 / ATCC MYA-4621 / FGSC 9543 / NRRL 43880) TaxID=246409 RepID=I1BNR7_RHIO9|nr:hypothetical protein RO3G_02551 [Rhizopus delemar RA 99-880]|eukprot:EIE77847.1 hypothetical protein RO3G_02551 [Rhizopus delemar RA 99-880]
MSETLLEQAKKFFENEIESEERVTDELRQICNQTYIQFNKALKALEHDVLDPNARKRTAQYLKDGLTYITVYKIKYRLDNSTQLGRNTVGPVVSQAEGNTDDAVVSQPEQSIVGPVVSQAEGNTDDAVVTQTEQSIVGYDSAIQDDLPVLPEPNANWMYVEDYIKNHGKKNIDWEKCYDEGRRKGHFKKHSSWRSTKSGYYRFLKKCSI